MSALQKRIGKASQPDPEGSAARLRQLSDEVGRIAASLAAISTGADQPSFQRSHGDEEELPQVSLNSVRKIIRARRLRAKYFDGELFSDPAWSMMLDLLQAEIVQHRVSVTSLCVASDVPATTALRWISSMTESGLFERRPDPYDGRRFFIELSRTSSLSLRRYFQAIEGAVVI